MYLKEYLTEIDKQMIKIMMFNGLLLLRFDTSNNRLATSTLERGFSSEDLKKPEFQRFSAIQTELFSSQSALEFKMNCELFGKDPKEDFEFYLRFALSAFTLHFSNSAVLWNTLIPSDLSSAARSAVESNFSRMFCIRDVSEDFRYEEFFRIRKFFQDNQMKLIDRHSSITVRSDGEMLIRRMQQEKKARDENE